jgi:hypothetical protein
MKVIVQKTRIKVTANILVRGGPSPLLKIDRSLKALAQESVLTPKSK